MTITEEPVGQLLRQWRERRRRSQLDVSLAADLSARHLSFIETGRAVPSRTMIERICEELEVPLRDRNDVHLAAGFAPAHPARALEDLGVARSAVAAVLEGHLPYPAVAVNVRWELMAANPAADFLLGELPAGVAGPPLNMLRATLHPVGLASQVRNYGQWRAHVVRRVRRQLERTAADGLAELLAEIESYPVPTTGQETAAGPDGDLVTPLLLRTGHGDLALCYAMTVFGAPRDVTLDEVAIETFFPADEATRELLRSLDFKLT